MLIHFPKTLRPRWFEKSADVCPTVRNGIQVPTVVGVPGGVGKILSINASSTVLRLSLLHTATQYHSITCNQDNFLRNHDGMKSENELLGNAFFLA